MPDSDIAIQVKSLRTQLDVLAAKLQSSRPSNGHTLADLHGILAGESQSSPEEIDRAIYRTPPNDQP